MKRRIERRTHEVAFNYLARHLPPDYLLVIGIDLPLSGGLLHLEAVVIKDKAIIPLQLLDWAGDIAGQAEAETIQAGERLEPNPLQSLARNAQALAGFLAQPHQAGAIFDDPRLVQNITITPILIFTNPQAHLQINGGGPVKVAHLTTAVQTIIDPQIGSRWGNLKQLECERLAAQLLNQPWQDASQNGHTRNGHNGSNGNSNRPVDSINRGDAMKDDTAGHGNDNGYKQTVAPSMPRLWHGLKSFILHTTDVMEAQTERFEEAVLTERRPKTQVKQNDLARLLEKELERYLHHLMRETVAHNHYTLKLCKPDFEYYQPFKLRGEAELQDHLAQVIQARDYKLVAPLVVTVLEDVTLSPGEYGVTSRIEQNIVRSMAGPHLELLPIRACFSLDGPWLTLGRSRYNDICLGPQDKRRVISRRHAHIRQDRTGFVIFDGVESQPSTWGTYVNGRRLTTDTGHRLEDGEQIILGPTHRLDLAQPLPGSLTLIFHA